MSLEMETVDVEPRVLTLDHESARIEVLHRIAKASPRSIERFRSSVLSLCTLNEAVAEQCLYALPRKSKSGEPIKIEGPSIRMAEIVYGSWKNCAVSARLIASNEDDVVAQATFIDFESVTMSSIESRRRITGRHADARSLAEAAAIAVARRNVVFGSIPRALWAEAYERAKAVAAGSMETLETRRREAIDWLVKKKVSEERIFFALDVEGLADIGLEELALLRTLVAQVRGGEMTSADAFPDPNKAEETQARGVRGVKEKLGVEGKDASETGRAS